MSKKQTEESSSEWARRRARIEADGALEVLRVFGFDIDDVNEMQKDILWLRRARKREENISAKAAVGIVGLFFAAVGVGAKFVWDKFTNGQ